MKQQRVLSFVLIIMFAAAWAMPAMAAEVETESAAAVQLTKTSGDVEVTKSSEKPVSVREGMRLYDGYNVTTGGASYAWINLDSTKLIKLDASSSIEIRKNGKLLEVNVKSGSAFFDVSKKLDSTENLNVRTATMAAGIRGTSGWTRVESQLVSEIQLLEGVCECAVSDPVTGQAKNGQLHSGETASCVVYPQDVNGERCDIVMDSVSTEEIPGFVLMELVNNVPLLDTIRDMSGLDILADLAAVAGGDPTGRSADGTSVSPAVLGLTAQKLTQAEQENAQRLQQMERAQARQQQVSNISADNVWGGTGLNASRVERPAAPQTSAVSARPAASYQPAGSTVQVRPTQASESAPLQTGSEPSAALPSQPAASGTVPTAAATSSPAPTGTSSPAADPTRTPASEQTPSSSAGPSQSAGASGTPGASAGPDTTPSDSVSPDASSTQSAAPTASGSASAEPTQSASAEPTRTAAPTATQSAAPTGSVSAEPEETQSTEPASSASPTGRPTETATASASQTSRPTGTATASASPTSRPTGTATATASPTSRPTDTATASASQTSRPTGTATASASPTSRPTGTATATASPTSRPTDTATATASPTSRPTDTATATASPTSSPTETATASASPTSSPTETATASASPTSGPTETPSSEPTDEPTADTSSEATPSPEPTPTPTPTPAGRYTVTFNANGGLVDGEEIYTVTTNEDDKLSKLPEATWEITTGKGESKFLNWYQYASGNSTTIVNKDTVFTKDTTVYARWSGWIQTGQELRIIGEYDMKDYYPAGTAPWDKTITSVVLDPGVMTVGENAFYGCSDLKSVTIPSTVTYIGADAFSGCSSLTNITIPSDVEEIGEGAFKDCTGLTTLQIPGSVTRIGANAFGGCSSTLHINYGGTKTAWYNAGGPNTGIASENVTCTDGAAAQSAGARQMRARPILPSYTITLDAAGGTCDVEVLLTNASGRLTDLPVPEKEGCVFEGWYTVNEDGDLVTTDTIFDQDAAIYAHWTEDGTAQSSPECGPFTIRLDSCGGTLEDEESSVTTDADGRLSALPEPYRDGYEFNGWHTSSTGGTRVDADTEFSRDTVLYAHWTSEEAVPTTAPDIQYSVRFDACGGTVSPNSAKTNESGRLSSLPTPVRENHTFAGWYTAKTGGSKISKDFVFAKDTTLYARWQTGPQETQSPEAAVYTIHLNTCGGSVGTASLKTGSDGTLRTLPVPERNNYTFVGWYTDREAGRKADTNTVFVKDTELYARWKANEPAPSPAADEPEADEPEANKTEASASPDGDLEDDSGEDNSDEDNSDEDTEPVETTYPPEDED